MGSPIEDVGYKFLSGNSIEVSQAVVTKAEWDAVVAYAAKLEKDAESHLKLMSIISGKLHR